MRWSMNGRRLMVGVLVLCGLALSGFLVIRFFNNRSAATHLDSATTAAAPEPIPTSPAVSLSEEKMKSAGIAVAAAQSVSLPFEVFVPGRIEPNVDRRVEIRTRVPGVIRTVAVLLGQKVKAGDLLVTLDSSEVATARLNLRGRQRDLSIARTEAEWRSAVTASIEDLVPALRKQASAADLEKQFASRPLGNDRALLLSAYADWEIARHEEEKQADLYQKRIVGEHAATLAQHTREGMQAKFEAALEQVRYDARRLKQQADQQVRLAEAAVVDAAERLRILGVPINLTELVARPEKALEQEAGELLTAYPIVAPFDGTIVSRSAVPSQRAEPTDVLMTLVDLENVRVVANISESDFSSLPELQNAAIRVTATAYPDRVFTAKLLTIGAEVEPTTRTVTLLAETPNIKGLLKLGMFVRISLDSRKAEMATVIPTSAVTDFDSKPAVFVPEKGNRNFRVQHVTLGREVNGMQVITSGLKPGEVVVTAGVFLLKSEIILQNEGEE